MEDGKTEEASTDNNTMMERIGKSMMSSMNTDVHAAVITDERTFQVHQKAERFNKDAEAMFVYLQVFSACFDALAHGANDVANAVGPFATIFLLYNGAELGSKQDMGGYRYLILGLGGIGIGVALLEGVRGFNYWVMGKAAFGWVFTCVFVGFVAGLMSALGAYAPMARSVDVIWYNASAA